MSEIKGIVDSTKELANALARLHQANRRAAAFEARCAQLLEEKVRLEVKVEGWRKIADGYARSASLEYRDNLEDEIWALQDRLSQLLEENERLRDREQHFARALAVADGGRYRNDWDGAIKRVLAERDGFKADNERLRKALMLAGAVTGAALEKSSP